MPQKGISNNPQGKPKGCRNKVNKDLREAISHFLQGNFESVIKTWQKASPKERLNFYQSLLKYSIPQLSNTDLTIDYDKMSDEQIERHYKTLIKISEQNDK